jgi:hypothetical protein
MAMEQVCIRLILFASFPQVHRHRPFNYDRFLPNPLQYTRIRRLDTKHGRKKEAKKPGITVYSYFGM